MINLTETIPIRTKFKIYFPIIIPELGICLIQFGAKSDSVETLKHLRHSISVAVEEFHPKIVALPECFNIAYDTTPSVLQAAAKTISDGITFRTLADLAKKFSIYIVGGSIIERDGNKLYNTCTVWNPDGDLIARHRKVSRH